MSYREGNARPPVGTGPLLEMAATTMALLCEPSPWRGRRA